MKYPAAGIVLPPVKTHKKGEHTMLVKAKWNVKDSSGWHSAGEIFETDNVESLGGAVEVLNAPKKEEPAQAETAADPVPAKAEEPKAESARPRSAARRKASK